MIKVASVYDCYEDMIGDQKAIECCGYYGDYSLWVGKLVTRKLDSTVTTPKKES